MVLCATLVLASDSVSQSARHRALSVPTPERAADPSSPNIVASIVPTTRPHSTDANDSSNVEARLRNATTAWDAGAFLVALDTFDMLLRGEDSSAAIERIALLTGEKWATSLIAENARAPRWSPDGQWIAMEVGVAASRVTRLMTPFTTTRTVVDVNGGALVFSPDGRRAAYVTGSGTDGAVVERELSSGAERTLTAGTLRVAQLAYSIDGSSLFVVGATAAASRTRLYQLAAGRPEMVLVESDSVIADVQIVAGGRQLVLGLGGRNPLGTGTGTAFARGAGRSRFGLYDIATRTLRELDGESPVVAADGSAMAFITRRDGRNRLHHLVLSAPGEPEVLHSTVDSLTNPAISPDGRRVVFQQMPRFDWELYAVTKAGDAPTRITREIQHDLLPRFVDERRVLAVVGEARHRRAWIHDLESGTHTRLFHNNTIRTISPEYEWVVSPDATKVLVVAERDGDTVTPHRHLWLVDLSRPVTLAELRQRLDTMRVREAALRAEGTRRFAPIATAVRAAVADVSTDRVYAYEKSLFDFDSKHITRPGNLKAREYLLAQYRSFGLTANPQPFEARVAVTQSTVPTANILAVLKGTENPELVYVVGSHFDSRAEGPGADDNTSGTAALLEAARVLSRRPQPATIIFASFTGEESGLLGSREFVRRAKVDSMRLVGALNNDMLGWSNDQRLDNTIRYSNPGIRDLQHAAAFLFTRMITYDAFYYKSTDAAAFYDGYGDIVGGIGSYPVLGNPHYHQPHDELEFENHQLIAEAAKTTVASLMLLASSPSRIGGITARAGTNGATVSWTPSPERGIVRYQVRYGPPNAPERWAVSVTSPRVVLPRAVAGMTVAVRAVNRRGLEGWDWGRAVVQ
jgi:Peptidase family M28/WD40-like Beta Propeller Repeat